MNKEIIEQLMNENESTYLDFKEKYHENKTDLIHDILCMANSPHNGDKYIIFGVTDDKETIGISEDVPTKKQNDYINHLRDIYLNKSIYNNIRFEFECWNQKKIGILTIEDRPDKPFFLLEDYNGCKCRKKSCSDCESRKKRCPDCKYGEKVIRAGVIYTRNADGNTPIDSSVNDDEMELLWRYRFGMDKPPRVRFYNYLENIEDWRRIDFEDKIESEYYHFQFPEFRVRLNDLRTVNGKNVPINDRWFPNKWLLGDGEITLGECRLMYWGLDLENFIFWWGDNGRDPVPVPAIISIAAESDSDEFSWSINRESLKYRIGDKVAKWHGRSFERILSETKISVIG